MKLKNLILLFFLFLNHLALADGTISETELTGAVACTSADDKFALFGYGGSLKLVDIQSKKVVLSTSELGWAGPCAPSPDGKYLLVNINSWLWKIDLETLTIQKIEYPESEFKDHFPRIHVGFISDIKITPDGEKIILDTSSAWGVNEATSSGRLILDAKTMKILFYQKGEPRFWLGRNYFFWFTDIQMNSDNSKSLYYENVRTIDETGIVHTIPIASIFSLCRDLIL